jgi:hypothetical protein
VKFDNNGDTIWWKGENGIGDGDDEAISACVDSLGNVFVTGTSVGTQTQKDIVVAKYDMNGNSIWNLEWNSLASLDDVPVDIKVDNAGDVYIGGVAQPDTFADSKDYITLKMSTDGWLVWEKQYSRAGINNGRDELRGIAVKNNKVCVTGTSAVSSIDDDAVTICYNTVDGTQLWLKNFSGGSGNDRGNCITTDTPGNFIVAGKSNNGSDHDFLTLKYNDAGTLLWSKLFDAPSQRDDEAFCITVDPASNIYVSGVM